MAHIDPAVRAAKAARLEADGAPLEAVYHALTGEKAPRNLRAAKVMKSYFHALDIDGDSLEEKTRKLEEFRSAVVEL